MAVIETERLEAIIKKLRLGLPAITLKREPKKKGLGSKNKSVSVSKTRRKMTQASRKINWKR